MQICISKYSTGVLVFRASGNVPEPVDTKFNSGPARRYSAGTACAEYLSSRNSRDAYCNTLMRIAIRGLECPVVLVAYLQCLGRPKTDSKADRPEFLSGFLFWSKGPSNWQLELVAPGKFIGRNWMPSSVVSPLGFANLVLFLALNRQLPIPDAPALHP